MRVFQVSTLYSFPLKTPAFLIHHVNTLSDWVDKWVTENRIVVTSAEVKSEPLYATTIHPPQDIEVHHVLTHALDHFALLSAYDPAVRSILTPAWFAKLCQRKKQASGYLPPMDKENIP